MPTIKHTHRSEAAALLLRLAQEQQASGPSSTTATAPTATDAAVALAVGAGAMDAFFVTKRLQSHPERAMVLAARAHALSALAAGVGGGNGEACLSWRRALCAHAVAAARGAVRVYEVAFGAGHGETEAARALLGRVEAEAGGLGVVV